MARGRLLRTKRREAYHLAKAEEKGKLQAQREHYRKLGFIEVLKVKIFNLMDRVSVDDIAFMTAWAGTTLVVKTLIDKTEAFHGQLEKLGFGPRFRVGAVSPFGRINPLLAQALGATSKKEFEGIFPDEVDWIISAGIAYVIVKYGADLASLGMKGVIGLLLGV